MEQNIPIQNNNMYMYVCALGLCVYCVHSIVYIVHVYVQYYRGQGKERHTKYQTGSY